MNLVFCAILTLSVCLSNILAQSFNYRPYNFNANSNLKLLGYQRSFDDELRPKIVGGEDAGRVVPYQISLQVKRRPGKKNSDWAHNCGGSILKPTLVLTAAHCVVR